MISSKPDPLLQSHEMEGNQYQLSFFKIPHFDYDGVWLLAMLLAVTSQLKVCTLTT